MSYKLHENSPTHNVKLEKVKGLLKPLLLLLPIFTAHKRGKKDKNFHPGFLISEKGPLYLSTASWNKADEPIPKAKKQKLVHTFPSCSKFLHQTSGWSISLKGLLCPFYVCTFSFTHIRRESIPLTKFSPPGT